MATHTVEQENDLGYQAMRRPNILLIMTDQQSASAISCSGNDDLRTPAIDGLAGQGTRFTRAYCTHPICTPSRASIFTGVMPHECGVVANHMHISDEFRSRELGNLLKDAGYECVYGGKWHVPQIEMPRANDHGFGVLCGFDDLKLADCCVRFFEQHRSDSKNGAARPFFMVASFDNPHNVCQYARNMTLPWGDVPEPQAMKDCPNLPANFAVPPFEPEIIREIQKTNWSIFPCRDHSPEEWRRLRWGYFRIVEKVDREVGRILDGLRLHELENETLVLFTSDHGDGHGSHRWNQKGLFYDESAKIPLIIKPPHSGQAGVCNECLVSNGLDIYPTVCQYAGIDVPPSPYGRSLKAIVDGTRATLNREAIYVEAFFGDGANIEDRPPEVLRSAPQGIYARAVLKDSWKYSLFDRGRYREMLVNLADDPGEMVNHAVETRWEHTLDEYRTLLRDYVRQTKDIGMEIGYWPYRIAGSVQIP